MAEKWQEKEHHHEEVVKKAVEAADRIILDGSGGSVEEIDCLTAKVARKFMEKASLSLTPEEAERKSLFYQP